MGGSVTSRLLTRFPRRSPPEALHRIVGDELECIDQGENHPAVGADRLPAFAEGIPAQHLEPIARFAGRKRAIGLPLS